MAHRGDLHGALLAAAAAEPRITLRPGFALASLAQTGEGVQVTSAGGETIAGRALVGADGLWSSVRQAVCPSMLPQFVGATATRAVIPAAEAGRLAAPVVGLWLTAGVHVVHYPVRAGAEIAVVVIASEDWQGRDWEAEADRTHLLARLGGFHAGLTEVLARVPQWRKWALYRLPPLPRWSAGRVTLMGDAAHPMLPYLAQGGVLALEDALVLGDCLDAHPGDEPGAFRDFEARRRRRAQRVQAMSLRQGRIYHLAPPLSWARDAVAAPHSRRRADGCATTGSTGGEVTVQLESAVIVSGSSLFFAGHFTRLCVCELCQRFGFGHKLKYVAARREENDPHRKWDRHNSLDAFRVPQIDCRTRRCCNDSITANAPSVIAEQGLSGGQLVPSGQNGNSQIAANADSS